MKKLCDQCKKCLFIGDGHCEKGMDGWKNEGDKEIECKFFKRRYSRYDKTFKEVFGFPLEDIILNGSVDAELLRKKLYKKGYVEYKYPSMRKFVEENIKGGAWLLDFIVSEINFNNQWASKEVQEEVKVTNSMEITSDGIH